MASGDNWTKEETSKKMKEDAIKVLNKAKKQEQGGKWVKVSDAPPTMVYKKEKKQHIVRGYYHELSYEERSTLRLKLTQDEINSRYKKPDWCCHLDPLDIEEGCPILQSKGRRGKMYRRICNDCMDCESNQTIGNSDDTIEEIED